MDARAAKFLSPPHPGSLLDVVLKAIISLLLLLGNAIMQSCHRWVIIWSDVVKEMPYALVTSHIQIPVIFISKGVSWQSQCIFNIPTRHCHESAGSCLPTWTFTNALWLKGHYIIYTYCLAEDTNISVPSRCNRWPFPIPPWSWVVVPWPPVASLKSTQICYPKKIHTHV